MGLDTQLVDDGTYFVVTRAGVLAGCGGWSRRATMYGGDQSPGRNSALLDPAKDAARIRAMYTHPDFVRRGIGRLILSLCEGAASPKDLRVPSLVPPRRESLCTAPVAINPSDNSSTIGAVHQSRF